MLEAVLLEEDVEAEAEEEARKRDGAMSTAGAWLVPKKRGCSSSTAA